MKLSGTPRHYMLLSQSQSDDEENVHIKNPKLDKLPKAVDLPDKLKKIQTDDKTGADPKTLPMSPLRTLAFIFSIFICFAFIAAFVWLVPCKPPVPTIDDVGKIVRKWSFMLNNISYITTDVISTNANGTNAIVLFGYSSSITSESHILAFSMVDGKVLWDINLYSKPTSIICDKIDANNDGYMDCLILGMGNLLTVIDVNKQGSNIWYIHNHKGIQNADDISFPVILTDCDHDSVSDLVVSYVISSVKDIIYLALISGRTGEVIGSLVPLQQCVSSVSAQFSMKWLNRTNFLIFCSDGKRGNLWFTQAEEICDIALNRTANIKFKLIYRNTHPSTVVQLKTLSFDEASFGMVINGSKILVFKANDNGQLRIAWSKNLYKKGQATNYPWKIIGHGKYMSKENTELLLLRSSNSTSQIIGLNMFNGRQLWSKAFNRLVVSVSELQNFFDNIDGLILKTLKSKNITQMQVSEETTDISSDVDEVTYFEIQTSDKKYNLIQEDYILLQGGKPPLTKQISSMEVFQYCDGFSCKPDFYNSKQTAVVTTSATGTVDMTVVSLNASSPFDSQTHIKLLSFKHLKHPNCLYKLSS